MSPRRLDRCEGRVALITGGSGGIGEALAAELARRGMTLALLARRPEALDASASRLRAAGARVTTHPCDVRDAASIAATVDAAVAAHGHLDLVAACAGIGRHVPFEEHDAASIDALLATNVAGHVHTLRCALPHLRENGGWIVSVSSVAGRLGQPDEAVYSASKFAVTGLTEALTIELAPRGIHVLAVYPGFVRTGFVPEAELARVPESALRTAVEPGAVARAIVHALERGRHELTVPKLAAGGYVVRTLAPGLFRRILTRLRRGVPS
jgi:3-oxoacyl-[acyl-carrier protein] reductase